MNGHSRSDLKLGDAQVAGIPRSPLMRLPMQINFLSQEKNPELLLPSASDRAWVGAIAQDQRRRLDEEAFSRFNQSADLSTYPRKNSVRTTRATAERLRLDDTRLGIMGGSYGGYIAMWAITQTHRFRAAVAHAGISDWLSLEGEAPQAGSDEVNFGGSVYDDVAPGWRQLLFPLATIILAGFKPSSLVHHHAV